MTTLTKEYFDENIAEMKSDIKEEIQGLATMVAKGFADLDKRLDVRERVDSLEKKMTKVESALNVRFYFAR